MSYEQDLAAAEASGLPFRRVLDLKTGPSIQYLSAEDIAARDAYLASPEYAAHLAKQATAAEDAAAVSQAKLNATIQYLATHTPAECAAKVQAEVTNLATAKDMLAHFAQALCVLVRRELR